MPLGWFLIPAVTGYWFLTHLHFTRYGALRDSGYHVFFRAIIAGVMLAFIAYTNIFLLNPHIPEVSTIWKSFMPIPYSGTAILTVLLGWVLPIVGNLFYEDFRIVIPMPEIGSTRLFHPEAYQRFKGEN